MPALDRKVKITCGNCGTSVTKRNLSREISSCSGRTLYCPKCPIFLLIKKQIKFLYCQKTQCSRTQKESHVWRMKHWVYKFFSLRYRYHTNNVITQQKLPQVERRWWCKVLWTQEVTKDWKKSYSRVDISWLVLKYKKGDIACLILLSTTWQLRL